jgi:hypothetical protein
VGRILTARGNSNRADRPELLRNAPGVDSHPSEEAVMPTYVMIHYTDRGVQTFKDLAQRLEETRSVRTT